MAYVNNYDYPDGHNCHASVKKEGIISVINVQKHNTTSDEHIEYVHHSFLSGHRNSPSPSPSPSPSLSLVHLGPIHIQDFQRG
jgi:hypothetical protein